MLAVQSQNPNTRLLRLPPLRPSVIPHSTSMSLIPHQFSRPILILTLSRNSLTGINRRGQTPRTPLPTIDSIIVVILALPEPKRRPAHRRRTLGSVPVFRVQHVQTPRHGVDPGRVGRGDIGRAASVVGAGAAWVVAGVGRSVSVDAVAVLQIRCYHAAQVCEGDTAATASATAGKAAAAAAFARGGCGERER